MPSVQHLCRRATLLSWWSYRRKGRPPEVIAQFLSDVHEGSSVSLQDWPDRVTMSDARLLKLDVANGNEPIHHVSVGGSVRFSIFVEFDEPLVDPCFGAVVHNAAGEPVLDIRSNHDGLDSAVSRAPSS